MGSDQEPKHPEYSSLTKREESFKGKWPHGDEYVASIESLAQCGFFYQPSPIYNDRCVCFFCDVALVGWEPDDEPFDEHVSFTPNCPALKGSTLSETPEEKVPEKNMRSIEGIIGQLKSSIKKKERKELSTDEKQERTLVLRDVVLSSLF